MKMAQDPSPLAALWQLLRDTRQQELAPILLRHGVRCREDIQSKAAELADSGIAPWRLELLTVSSVAEDQPPRPRWDIPVVRPGKRASLQAALNAAQPNNRRRCMEALERAILAHTTQPSFDSKVRTYMAICPAWQVQPWPISLESLQCFAASLKEGAYKSSQGFFQAIFTHQRRHLQVEVAAVIKGAAKDYSRSISRGKSL